MTASIQHQQRFLISWYHPTEREFALDAHWWVVGRNEDFGYEIICSTVRTESEAGARELISESYGELPPAIQFRFCAPESEELASETWCAPADRGQTGQACTTPRNEVGVLAAA